MGLASDDVVVRGVEVFPEELAVLLRRNLVVKCLDGGEKLAFVVALHILNLKEPICSQVVHHFCYDFFLGRLQINHFKFDHVGRIDHILCIYVSKALLHILTDTIFFFKFFINIINLFKSLYF